MVRCVAEVHIVEGQLYLSSVSAQEVTRHHAVHRRFVFVDGWRQLFDLGVVIAKHIIQGSPKALCLLRIRLVAEVFAFDKHEISAVYSANFRRNRSYYRLDIVSESSV